MVVRWLEEHGEEHCSEELWVVSSEDHVDMI